LKRSRDLMGESLMDFTELSGAIGAEIRDFSGGVLRGFSSVSIDSRTVERGGLFVALPGLNEDGHRYAAAALQAGASAVMVSQSRVEDGDLGLPAAARKAQVPLIVVKDTLRGLRETARAYLDKFPGLLRVGITGSSGKTTTKEIAAAMIGGEKRVVMNPGNLNSETGLPLAVFGVRPEHEVGIFEMGMNRPGEIAELAGVLKPRIALITNIGSAHIGIFGSKEEIAKEKKKIFSEFTGTETALIPEDDDFRDFLAEGVRGRVCFYGPESFTEIGPQRNLDLEGAEITWEGVPARFNLPGKHNLKNALAAAAIARAIPVGPEAIRGGLGLTKPLFGRSEILRGTLCGESGEPLTVVQDCYNSNPESAAEAIGFCDSLQWPGRRVYVIGSMLELGERTGEAHRRIGEILAASRADMVFLYGPETQNAATALEDGRGRKIPFFRTDTMKVLCGGLAEYARPGDLVLLKGSRSCALEQVTKALLERG
jgi:UDP-N-acetylmuramoyl-tripeptide--D-alanyl-D-alanine ligase